MTICGFQGVFGLLKDEYITFDHSLKMLPTDEFDQFENFFDFDLCTIYFDLRGPQPELN